MAAHRIDDRVLPYGQYRMRTVIMLPAAWCGGLAAYRLTSIDAVRLGAQEGMPTAPRTRHSTPDA